MVTFSYKDYKGHAKGGELHRTMTLSASEFIRRFLLRVLPHGFNKVRFYGFWAINIKKDTLPLIRSLLADDGPRREADRQPTENTGQSESEGCETVATVHYLCPKCGKEMAYWAQIEAQSCVAFTDSS